MTAPRSRNPYDELADLIERPNENADRPKFTGSSIEGIGTSDERQREALVNPMTAAGQMLAGGEGGGLVVVPAGTTGQVLVVDGSGNPGFSDEGSIVGGGKYRQYLIADDGSSGWGFVEATVDGVTRPVTALFDLESG